MVATQADEINKQVMLKNCTPFTDSISEISSMEPDNAKDLVAVLLTYDLIEYSNNYSKTSGG